MIKIPWHRLPRWIRHYRVFLIRANRATLEPWDKQW